MLPGDMGQGTLTRSPLGPGCPAAPSLPGGPCKMPRSWLQRRKTPWGWWALSPPPPWGQLQPHHYGVALGWVPLATPYTYHWPRGSGGPVPARQPRRSQQVRAVHPKPPWLPWQTGYAGWPWGTGWPSRTLEEKEGTIAECVPPLPAGRTGTHPHSPAGSPGHHQSQSPPCR